MATALLPLARAASLMEVGPALRQTLITKWGCDSCTALALDGVDDAVSQGILEHLLEQGISLGPEGAPLSEPTAAPQNALALLPPTPQRNLLSRMLRFIAAQKFETVRALASRAQAVQMQAKV